MKRTPLRRIGAKGKNWLEARARLVDEYTRKSITSCERCGSGWALSFHHLDKRSSGKAEHTFAGTVLLCPSCHDICEYNKAENERMREKRERMVRMGI